jgi:predicted DCC family thiol-disulfide oxidoreductase YuxK
VEAAPIIVFDGECGFCRCSVNWARRHLGANVRYVAWQATDLAALGLTAGACREAVQWVDGGHIASGHRAVAALLRRAGRPWRLLGVVIDLPVLRLVARAVYALVKANRSRLVHLCRQPIE